MTSAMHSIAGSRTHPLLPYRSSILSLVKLLVLTLFNLPALHAAPLERLLPRAITAFEAPEGKDAEDPTLWIYLTVAMALVITGGAFAGLTIALMGQDEIYLQVIQTSGEGAERKHAARVLRLLKRGKHWVLVTLLLSNVITNETLPIVLDRSLGGGWPAVLGSTVLIVIFGEIIPQSICVRYGLPIGAWMSAPVLVLMYIMAPVAWPTAKLLDKLLGTDHGTTYKKAGLKTLVTLHKTLGEAGEQLNSDEVTIISAVLDLKDKPVGAIMTPMDDVFTMSANTILDEKTMDIILSAGYSRIPIHAPDNPLNFIGMLLVKMLITYDPEDCKPVHEFSLATLPETRPETSCLDIVNYFQEGKSHMVLVTDFPGEDCGALGVVTLEDVIEELIGEEIIDESDVFIDVHKAIRRLTPAPWTRVPRGTVLSESDHSDDEDKASTKGEANGRTDKPALRRFLSGDVKAKARKLSAGEFSRSPKTTVRLRRSSSTAGGTFSDGEIVTRRADAPELRDHLMHLGPSNLASRPKSTRYTSVKIKPGGAMPVTSFAITDPETLANTAANAAFVHGEVPVAIPPSSSGGIGEGLVSSAGRSAKDGVQAVQAGYGTLGTSPLAAHRPTSSHSRSSGRQRATPPQANKGVQVDQVPSPRGVGSRSQSHQKLPQLGHPHHQHQHEHHSRHGSGAFAAVASGAIAQHPTPSQQSLQQHLANDATASAGGTSHRPSRTHSTSTLDSLQSIDSGRNGSGLLRRTARSGSITENIVESGGFTKVVLEMTSSSDETPARSATIASAGTAADQGARNSSSRNKADDEEDGANVKRRRKRRKGRTDRKRGLGGEMASEAVRDEITPLLGRK